MVGGDSLVALDPTATATADNAAPRFAARVDALLGASWPAPAVGKKLVIAGQDRRRGAFLKYVDPGTGEVVLTSASSRPPVRVLGDLSGVVHLDGSSRTLIARGPTGAVRWRSPLGARVSGLEVRGDLIWAAAGRVLRALDVRDGEPVRKIELDEPITALAFGDDLGLVTVESGAVYGLPGTQDPRPRLWLRRARFDIARCHIAAGRRQRAEAMAEQIILRAPDDLDALALVASARARRRPRAAAALWAQIARVAPRGDPLQGEAAAALRSLIGVETRLSFDQAIETVATSTDGVVAIRSGDAVAAVVPGAKQQPAWRRSGSALANAGGAALVLGAALIRARDGSPLRTLGTDGYVFTPGGSIRPGDGATLIAEDRDGRAAWTRRFEHARAVVLAATEPRVFIGDGAKLVHVIDASSGAALWMRPFDTDVTAVIPSGDAAIVRTADKLIGVAAGSGEVSFKRPIKGEVAVHAVAGGWMLQEGEVLLLLNEQGAVRRRVRRPRGAKQLVVDRDSTRAFAITKGAGLVAIDLTRGRVGAAVELGGIEKLVVGGGKLVAIEAGGQGALVFDAASALR